MFALNLNIKNMKIKKEELSVHTEKEVIEFIKDRLKFKDEIINQLKYTDLDLFKKEHRRFEMSGYEDKTGQCTLHNLSILNEFADLGIYDYTEYLFLDFYKGTPKLYFKYFANSENNEIDLSGYGTCEIIYKIFQLTIFSNKMMRRRE